MKNQTKYTHIKKTERLEIAILLEKGYSLRRIAKVLKRNHGSVSREIRENSVNGVYDPQKADHKAYVKRKYSKYQGKNINENQDIWKYIIQRLRCYWSPDEISGRMKQERQPFCASKTAIYEWLYNVWGQYWCSYLYSRRYRPRKRKEIKIKKTLIPNRKGLELRPKEADKRLVEGHYEGDTMVSGKKTGSKTALAVVYDRKTKYLDAEKIPTLKPGLFNKAISIIRQRVVMKTFTLDNGIENTKYEELNLPTYFCDPYASWQKGGVEQSIKMVRRFIPKGTDIAGYSDDYVKMVVEILNDKPRKSLGYRTPVEAMMEENFKRFSYQNLIIKKPEGVALQG